MTKHLAKTSEGRKGLFWLSLRGQSIMADMSWWWKGEGADHITSLVGNQSTMNVEVQVPFSF